MLERINIDTINEIAKAAGDAIMEIYQQDIAVKRKEDNSPLTIADQGSNDIIVGRLREIYPEIAMISEENKQIIYEERKNWEYFWLIDPLDGTKEFIKKNGEFTVNIALIHHGEPVLGVVYVPAKEELYYAQKGKGSYKIYSDGQKVALRSQPPQNGKIAIAGSRSHGSEEMQRYLEEKKKKYEVEFIAAGSSLKFCLIAEGKANEYPRLGPTMEWDTAAGHAIAVEAGAQVLNWEDGKPLIYNKENLLNPNFIVKA